MKGKRLMNRMFAWAMAMLMAVSLIPISGVGTVTVKAEDGETTETATTLDISTITDSYYTIKGDGTYILTGEGNLFIRVQGSPTIILRNVKLHANTENAISIESGDVMIKVEGENEITSDDGAGIEIAKDYTVTITSDDRYENMLTCKGGNGAAGIGGGYDIIWPYKGHNEPDLNFCGNIHIKNVTVDAYGSCNQYGERYAGAGIGAVGYGTCGAITIENAIVHAYGQGTYEELAGCAIGLGAYSNQEFHNGNMPLFGITIRDSMIYTSIVSKYADYIGSSWYDYGEYASKEDKEAGIKREGIFILSEDKNVKNEDMIIRSMIYGHVYNTPVTEDIPFDYRGKEDTPSAVFTATGDSSGILSNVDDAMKYSLDGGATWKEIEGDTAELADVTTENGIKVYKKGTIMTSFDSDVQTIEVTKAETPKDVKSQNRKIVGVDNTMEYKSSTSSEWIDVTGDTIEGLKGGDYDVRVKANGTVLASDSVSVFVTPDTWKDEFGGHLTGYSLSLKGNIGVNFYMELSREVAKNEDAYMQFTLPNGDTSKVFVSEAKKNTTLKEGTTYYVFSCEVAAKEMTGDIEAQLVVGDQKGTVYTYTVKDYADYVLSHTDQYDAETIEIIKAMLNYGAYTQTYFNYRTDKLANADLTEEEQTLSEVTADNLSDYVATLEGADDLCTFASASLSLKSETEISVYVKLADGVNLDDVTFKIDGTDVEKDELETATIRGEYYYRLKVNGVKASDLDKMHTFTVAAGEKTASLSYGTLTYCRTILSGAMDDSIKNIDELKDVAKALRIYNQAAEAYIAK